MHPNVARHHLDKLAAGGYVEVVAARRRRRGAGPGARRSATSPSPTDGATTLVPVRSDDLVLALLGRALDRLPRHEAEAMAEEVGATYGRAMAAGLTGDALAAGQRSLRSAMQAVADALTAHGFAAHMAARSAAGAPTTACGSSTTTARSAPSPPITRCICAVDRGMVRGMLGALYRQRPGSTSSPPHRRPTATRSAQPRSNEGPFPDLGRL